MEHTTVQSTVVAQNCSSSKQEDTGDPVMFVGGHYVGHDGFVVPKDFLEFYVRFPQHIRRWVRRHADKSASKEDIEDWTQDLCVHMSSLPATSKHREAGKQDVIQTFDPFRHYGANLARFLNYVNHCLTNKFRTIHSTRIKSPLDRAKGVSQSEIGEVASTDDASCRVLSERAKNLALCSQKQAEDKLLIGAFIDFVRSENPRFLSALEAIAMTSTQEEAARKLGTPSADYVRLCRQLRELGHSFLSRKARPQPQRRSETQYGTETNDYVFGIPLPPAPRGVDFRSNYWNRVELYNEVWHQPLVKLAKKYGISDVRIGKVCRKLKIPHPGRGYWAKRAVGQTLDQVPLTEFKDAPVVRRLKLGRTAVYVNRGKRKKAKRDEDDPRNLCPGHQIRHNSTYGYLCNLPSCRCPKAHRL
jgi:hypothetical protein